MSKRKAPQRVWAVLYEDGIVLDAYRARWAADDRKRSWEAAGNVAVRVIRYDLHEPKPKRARKARRAG